MRTVGAFVPRSVPIDSSAENADCFYKAVWVAMGYDVATVQPLATALKARTVLNLFLTHRLDLAEFTEALLPSSLAHNEHYMQVAMDLDLCIWFMSFGDQHLAVYNHSGRKRIYIGWHNNHVRPIFFWGGVLTIDDLKKRSWEIDKIETWFDPQGQVGKTATTPNLLYEMFTRKTGLYSRLDVRYDGQRRPRRAYIRCPECGATLATMVYKEHKLWELTKAPLDHRESCVLFSYEHCTIRGQETSDDHCPIGATEMPKKE
ncbi:hypothetical protein ADUPG1_006260 [Aduncisulcus paluster]|uniref:OTU domain-containing protein n=1 Tax=Aduncisulcus paluster TaxID=2918883 RepID=A0ABQ5KJ47_9EUKA|nr:hypothetical protein ADUPG1_006260 [Aduncisulcus paluster]